MKVEEGQVLAMEDGETRVFRIERYHVAEADFPQMGVVPPRKFRALRLLISREDNRPVEREYWIDSKRLIAGLLPLLQGPAGCPGTYKIHKIGVPPRSTYEVKRAR